MSNALTAIGIIQELLESRIALQRARRSVADENPISSAIDRAHAMGGELALIELQIDIQNLINGLSETQSKRA
jgi:hypothetical protein